MKVIEVDSDEMTEYGHREGIEKELTPSGEDFLLQIEDFILTLLSSNSKADMRWSPSQSFLQNYLLCSRHEIRNPRSWQKRQRPHFRVYLSEGRADVSTRYTHIFQSDQM
jgi:hypothetical protein